MPPNTETPVSSFPIFNSKEHTGRNVGFWQRTPLTWLEGKKQDDGAEGLWRINDKLYDLNDFMNRHPGGKEWIRITKGTDITELYESCHITEKPDRLLPKLYAREASTPRFSPYTFHENGFFRTMKRKIRPILAEIGTGPTLQMTLVQDGLFLAFFITSLLAAWLSSFPLMILSGLILTPTSICSHNFWHQKENWRAHLFDFTLNSSLEWRVSHALSHHCYPNTVRDLEISLFEPNIRFLPVANKTWANRYGVIVYHHLMNVVDFFLAFVKRCHNIFTGAIDIYWYNFIPLVHAAILMFLNPLYGLPLFLTMHCTNSFTFLLLGMQAAHHHPLIFHDGDKARDDMDWGLQQLDAVRDRKVTYDRNFFISIVTFGDHALHHLFPTIDQSKTKKLYKVFFETLKEFNYNYEAYSLLDHQKGLYQQLRRIEPNTKAPYS